MKHYLILIAGLPGTGKTTTASTLINNLDNYILIDQNNLRREHGMKRMPKNQDLILRKIDRLAAQYLNLGKGAIVESGHRHGFRRQQLYGVASAFGIDVITLECVCSENESKTRMRNRPITDSLLSDPRAPEVYDRIEKLWEEIDEDFKFPGVNHVSHIIFDTEKSEIIKKRIAKGASSLIRKIEKILLNNKIQQDTILPKESFQLQDFLHPPNQEQGQ